MTSTVMRIFKIYFGIEEFQPIIEQALEGTKLAGRVSAIQRIPFLLHDRTST